MSDEDDTQQIFGIDVHGLSDANPGVFDARVFGYPKTSLADVRPGTYWVQAVLHPYEVWHRADGHTVELPPDHGEGQQWSRAPGSPMSRPKWVRIDTHQSGTVHIALDTVIPPLPEIQDTKYVKHIRIQSERLTKFWGKPMFLGAILILPEGFDTHPDAHYPLAVYQGHFQREPSGWREQPPDASLPAPDTAFITRNCPNGSERGGCDPRMLRRLQQEAGYRFYQQWTGPSFPRVIQVTIQHANPYYDDSYAVNSENVGPYGDAITYELIPYIEQHYRGIGPWARALYGGSTGGWEAVRRTGSLSRPVQRDVRGVSRSDRLPAVHELQHLQRQQRVLHIRPVAPHAPRRRAGLPGRHAIDGRATEPARAGPRHALPVGRTVGHLGSGVLAGGPRRLPAPHL